MTTDVVLIALFGARGTGKTTFVNDASGGDLQVGHKSHACTQDVAQSPPFQVDGRTVVLFDTPGFDDTHLSDGEILKRITGFLATSYEKGYKLTGIIYLHRITDIRVGGISRRTFGVFRKLCGKDSLSNVLIVTNMWSDPPAPEQIERESELRDHPDFFQPVLEQGATLVRRTHKNTESAHEIIRQLLKKEPIVMSVQRELVEERKELADTGAGRELEKELVMATERHKAEMKDLKKDMEEALRDQDERTRKELAEVAEKAKAEERKELADTGAEREVGRELVTTASTQGQTRVKVQGKKSQAEPGIPKLVALFGATGTGKTTFVNNASGGNLEVGDHLESCTQEVSCSRVFKVDGQDIVLFDTPGFDDTELSDTEILKRIAAFLTSTYVDGHKLTGVIYLHRITDNRMTGMSRRTFKILRELCGRDSLSNVLIVTNMWSDPPTPREIQNEKQLQESQKFFQPAIQAGARMIRRPRKDTESAHDIIRLLLDKKPVAMKIQRQIVDNGEGFFSTDAARVLGQELAEAEQRHLKEIEEAREELRKAKEENDLQTQTELREYLEQASAESARLAKEIQSLRQGFDEERLRWEKRVDAAEEARREAEREQKEMANQLEELRRKAEESSGHERRMWESSISELKEKIAEMSKRREQKGCIVM